MTESNDMCEVVKTLEFFSDFAQGDLCGRCLPCPHGTKQVMAILRRFTQGEAEDRDMDRLRLISLELGEVALCRRGRDAAKVLSDSLSSGEYEEHVEEKRCARKTCEALTTYRVVAEKCTMCGKCKEVCPEGAVFGEEYVPYLADNAPYVIKPEKCTRCGLCVEACPEDAIELV